MNRREFTSVIALGALACVAAKAGTAPAPNFQEDPPVDQLPPPGHFELPGTVRRLPDGTTYVAHSWDPRLGVLLLRCQPGQGVRAATQYDHSFPATAIIEPIGDNELFMAPSGR